MEFGGGPGFGIVEWFGRFVFMAVGALLWLMALAVVIGVVFLLVRYLLVATKASQRYLDLTYNEGVLDRFLDRTRIVSSIRKTLGDRGFVEVERRIIQFSKQILKPSPVRDGLKLCRGRKQHRPGCARRNGATPSSMCARSRHVRSSILVGNVIFSGRNVRKH